MTKLCHAVSRCRYCMHFNPRRFSPGSEVFCLRSFSPLLPPRVQFTVCTQWRVTEETIYRRRSVVRSSCEGQWSASCFRSGSLQWSAVQCTDIRQGTSILLWHDRYEPESLYVTIHKKLILVVCSVVFSLKQ
jgi:hypothetical protein